MSRALERVAGGAGGVHRAGGRARDRKDAAARRAGRGRRSGAAVSCSAGAPRSSSATRPTACGPMPSTRTSSAWSRRACCGWTAASSAPLAVALPAFATALGGPVPPAERYVVHRAIRGLLERLAAARPLVLCLDDVHWADPASLDLLAALARRPPERAVLLAVAYREGQAPDALVAALGDAARAPLGAARAAAAQPGRGGHALRRRGHSCGSSTAQRRQPVLPRAAHARSDPMSPSRPRSARASRPPSRPRWRESSTPCRPMLGACWRPRRSPASRSSPTSSPTSRMSARTSTLASLDAAARARAHPPHLVPRRFAFRHPVIRHAVYAAAPGAWRLRAHARAAAALERRGAGPVERAHHVEHAARRGDHAAVDLLAAAAERVSAQAPASAARYLESALRLLPDDAGRRPTADRAAAGAGLRAARRGAARRRTHGARPDAGARSRATRGSSARG